MAKIRKPRSFSIFGSVVKCEEDPSGERFLHIEYGEDYTVRYVSNVAARLQRALAWLQDK